MYYIRSAIQLNSITKKMSILPPLYRYPISELPEDIFENLESTTTEVSQTASFLKLQFVIHLRLVDDGITTVAKLLQLSPYGIFHRVDPILTLSECIRLYQRICIHCTPSYKSALTLLSPSSVATLSNENPSLLPCRIISRKNNFVSTGWNTLDKALLGGIRIGTITELMGCAGTGKTQLAMQTAITTALHYHFSIRNHDTITTNGGGTIWIDAEQKISLRRLQEMALSRCRSNGLHDESVVLENITIHSPTNMNECMQVLDSLEREIVDRNADAIAAAATSSNFTHSNKLPVRLIVIDSIAAAMRCGDSTKTTLTAPQQAIGAMQMAQILKRYADQYSIAILVINQVTSSTMHHDTTTNHYQPQQRAALGTAWHHCVTTRIELQQYEAVEHDTQHHYHHPNYQSLKNTSNDGLTKYSSPRRQAKIVKSVTVEPSYTPLPFQITTCGIVD